MTVKGSRLKEFKFKVIKPVKKKTTAPLQANVAEFLEQSKKNKKNKKRRIWKHHQDHIEG